ncbi:hypothetical protein KAT24_01625 [Candidatus Pacearchaeota archaeon]|nr:hypothetical protein [Candidatus Pacearchaeota archaeon]
MKRGALQISFGWLFAIIIGAFIIFLAVFGVTKLMKTEQTTIDAKSGKELGVLLNPLETSLESAKTTSFTMPAESRIYNGCNNAGNFGKQLIKISQKSFNKWTETNIDVGFSNKYIFSKEIVEGKKFYIFSKPFDFPFKVSDLMYITSSKDIYCFVDAPEEIEEEIKTINQTNLLVGDCSDNMINVCFSGNCDINVDYDEGYVKKQGEIHPMYFVSDALMYAAIFGDVEVYECQLKRLMQRIEELSLIYRDKTRLISKKGCEFDINADLVELNMFADNFDESEDIIWLESKVNNLNDKNEAAGECGLW